MRILIAIGILFSVITVNAQQSIAGVWNTGNENTKIKITETNGIYSGKVISSDNAKAKIGTLLLKDIKSSSGGWKGKLYSPQKDKWYNAVLEEKGEQLLVTIKVGIMSKTLEWEKG